MNWQQRPVLWGHFINPKGAGEQIHSELLVRGQQRSPVDGAELELDIGIDDHTIEASSFRAWGGVSVIAVGSYLCAQIIGFDRAALDRFQQGLVENLVSTLELGALERPVALLADDVVRDVLLHWASAEAD